MQRKSIAKKIVTIVRKQSTAIKQLQKKQQKLTTDSKQ